MLLLLLSKTMVFFLSFFASILLCFHELSLQVTPTDQVQKMFAVQGSVIRVKTDSAIFSWTNPEKINKQGDEEDKADLSKSKLEVDFFDVFSFIKSLPFIVSEPALMKNEEKQEEKDVEKEGGD